MHKRLQMILYTNVDKASFRSLAKSAVEDFSNEYLLNSDAKIIEKLLSLPVVMSAGRIFSYYSIGREINTSPITAFCAKSGKTLAFPCDMKEGTMSFGVYGGNNSLSAGSFGIMCPGDTAERIFPEPGDVIIVPSLCYDKSCFRLGRGGGYYDRFLKQSKAVSIGLCRDMLIFETLPHEAHDIPTDLLISESALYSSSM